MTDWTCFLYTVLCVSAVHARAVQIFVNQRTNQRAPKIFKCFLFLWGFVYLKYRYAARIVKYVIINIATNNATISISMYNTTSLLPLS